MFTRRGGVRIRIQKDDCVCKFVHSRLRPLHDRDVQYHNNKSILFDELHFLILYNVSSHRRNITTVIALAHSEYKRCTNSQCSLWCIRLRTRLCIVIIYYFIIIVMSRVTRTVSWMTCLVYFRYRKQPEMVFRLSQWHGNNMYISL